MHPEGPGKSNLPQRSTDEIQCNRNKTFLFSIKPSLEMLVDLNANRLPEQSSIKMLSPKLHFRDNDGGFGGNL